MASFLRTILGVVSVFFLLDAHAQGGIRAIPWNYEPFLGKSVATGLHYGIGYDQDLNERLSLNVSFRWTANGWVANYRSAFHFSDNTESSLYMGPSIGVRSVGERDGAICVPVGLRSGLRGGLERFYADLYVGMHANLGGGGRSLLYDGRVAPDLLRASLCIGLDLGWGWAGR
jgi:hypothetical protein